MYRISLLALGFILLIVGPVFSDEKSQATEQLSKIQKNIEREEKRLNELQREQGKIQRSLDILSDEKERIEGQSEEVTKTLGKIENASSEIEEKVEGFEEELVGRRDTLRKRIVSIFKMRKRIGLVDFLVGAEDANDLLQRSRYLKTIANYDRKRMADLSNIIVELDQKKAKLVLLKDQRQKSALELKQLASRLEKKRYRQASLLEEVRHQKKKKSDTLDELRRSAEKLEGMLSRLMGSEETKVPKGTPTPKLLPPFKGKGLTRARLSLPVQGSEIVQGFGKRKHEEFSDIILSKGLEFRAPVGAKVKAIAPGRVILSQVLPGFGNVVILDHGKRFYSLYGRLASSLVQREDRLEEGDVIAVLGELGEKGRNFYFEIRKRGKAVDPMPYFSRGQAR